MNYLHHIKSIIVTTLILIGISTAALAQEDPIAVDSKGHAIRGYDTVAYFTDKKAIKGSEEISCEWGGATWLFSSEENKEKFLQNPEKYAPQYGGYCAHALSKGEGKIQNSSPVAWTVHDDKLYFSNNEKFNKKWGKNIKRNVSKADENWLNLKLRF